MIEPIPARAASWSRAGWFLPASSGAGANGIVFVADEIQTGFGRTGTLFACDDEASTRDLLATAKGIAGGMPLAAVTGRAEVMDAVHVGGLGGTYGGNPVACAAALGALESLSRTTWLAAPAAIGRTMPGRLAALSGSSTRRSATSGPWRHGRDRASRARVRPTPTPPRPRGSAPPATSRAC